jgi:LruC domain-containing protein
MKTLYISVVKAVMMMFVLFNITALHAVLANEFIAVSSSSCEITKHHGEGYSTTIESVVDNCDGTHTIVLRVDHDGCSGPSCQDLSNYAIEAEPGTYSNVSVNVTSGGMSYSNIDMGPNLGAQIPFEGFKVDGISGIGDGKAGSFTVTYTLSGGLQDQQVSAKPGADVYVKTFTKAEFESVMTCQGNTCPGLDGPTAKDDFATTPFETPVDIDILDNDVEGDAALDPTTVTFIAGTEPNPATEGVFTYDASTGLATFTPASGFNGTVTIDYEVCDLNSLCDIATITVVVEPETALVGPTANDDFETTDIDTPVDIDILANDVEGDAALDPSTVTFIAGTEPDAGSEGVFTYNASTVLATFTPASGFTGTVTIDYEVCDFNALCDTATITVVIDPLDDPVDNFFPATGLGTLAFEDLWPGKGDYDFNDLVIDYQFEINSSADNYIEKVTGTFIIKAFGAGYQNGFGFQLSDAIDASDLSVSGYSITENYINLSSNGTEAGQSAPTIIVFDNAYNEMQHPGVGIGVNTEPSAPYVAPKTLTVTIEFPADTYTWNDLDIANFNPFIIVNQDRSVEVHLPGYAPTDLADLSLFGTEDDASNLSQGKTYVTSNNLPWAIHIYEQFDYPIEKQDIVWVHLKFVEWAESGGVAFPDWYKNLPGYRNNALIYQQP